MNVIPTSVSATLEMLSAPVAEQRFFGEQT
jgi:hypothetical protein